MSRPFLVGKRVLLRPLEEEDAETYAEWLNQPQMRDYLLVRFPISLTSEREWIAGMISMEGNPSNIVLAIERKTDGKHIGSVGLHQINWLHRRATTGSFISPARLRGKGYGSEAKGLLLDYAFGELGMRSLWSIAFEGNIASCRALEKQGYKENGRFRKAHLVKGEWVDGIYYDILREEWEARGHADTPRKKTGRMTRK